MSGVATFSTGSWYTIRSGKNFANSDGSNRPDVVPGQDPNGTPCVAGTVFNTCAFQYPAVGSGSFGNAGKNIVQGPGYKVVDFSLMKDFRFSERTRMEFRAEFFNFPNHTNFRLAATGSGPIRLGSSSFGYATAARDPRQIQFGLKLYF
jgi:hypothetical protein